MGAIKKLPSVLISLFISFLIVYVILTVLAGMVGGVNISPIQEWIQNISAPNLPNEVSVTHWIIALLVLFAVAKAVPDKLKGVIMAITLIVLVTPVILRYSPSIENAESNMNRAINHGDWSEPADYVRTINGGTLTIRTGEVIIANIIGKVRIPKPPQNCININPWDNFFVTEDAGRKTVFIQPKSGQAEEVKITALPAYQC